MIFIDLFLVTNVYFVSNILYLSVFCNDIIELPTYLPKASTAIFLALLRF